MNLLATIREIRHQKLESGFLRKPYRQTRSPRVLPRSRLLTATLRSIQAAKILERGATRQQVLRSSNHGMGPHATAKPSLDRLLHQLTERRTNRHNDRHRRQGKNVTLTHSPCRRQPTPGAAAAHPSAPPPFAAPFGLGAAARRPRGCDRCASHRPFASAPTA
jgi:hypothetical protein